MRPFVFCPSCATKLEPGPESSSRCPGCDRSWYRNSAPTAGCVLLRDGKALITQRGIEPEKGRFDVPGGFLQAGEHPIDGLKRELAEELGVTITADVTDCVSMVPHRYGPEGDFVLALGFIGTVVEGEPSPADDVAAYRWVGRDEIDDIDFAWDHDRELVKKALALSDGSLDD